MEEKRKGQAAAGGSAAAGGGGGGGDKEEESFWTMAMEAKGEEDFRSLIAKYQREGGGGSNDGGGRGGGGGGGANSSKNTKKSKKKLLTRHASGDGDGESLLTSVPAVDAAPSSTRVREVEMGSLDGSGGGGGTEGQSRGADGDRDDDDGAELGLMRGLNKSTAATAAGAERPAPPPPPPLRRRPRPTSINLNAGGGDAGWDRHTITAAASYAALAAIAIGYDEIFPVYAKTSRSLGGLDLSAQDIGVVLIFGGFALVTFQITLFPAVLARLGVTRALRVASLAGGHRLSPSHDQSHARLNSTHPLVSKAPLSPPIS